MHEKASFREWTGHKEFQLLRKYVSSIIALYFSLEALSRWGAEWWTQAEKMDLVELKKHKQKLKEFETFGILRTEQWNGRSYTENIYWNLHLPSWVCSSIPTYTYIGQNFMSLTRNNGFRVRYIILRVYTERREFKLQTAKVERSYWTPLTSNAMWQKNCILALMLGLRLLLKSFKNKRNKQKQKRFLRRLKLSASNLTSFWGKFCHYL